MHAPVARRPPPVHAFIVPEVEPGGVVAGVSLGDRVGSLVARWGGLWGLLGGLSRGVPGGLFWYHGSFLGSLNILSILALLIILDTHFFHWS